MLHHKHHSDCKTLDCLMLTEALSLKLEILREIIIQKYSLIGCIAWKASLGGYRLADERKVFFLEAKLKGKTRFWRAKYHKTHYATIRSYEDVKIAMTRYFAPVNYKQRGSTPVEEYTGKFYSLATRPEFPRNEML